MPSGLIDLEGMRRNVLASEPRLEFTNALQCLNRMVSRQERHSLPLLAHILILVGLG